MDRMPPDSFQTNVIVLGATGRVGQMLVPVLARLGPQHGLKFWFQSRHSHDGGKPDWFVWVPGGSLDGCVKFAKSRGSVGAIINLLGETHAVPGAKLNLNTSLVVDSLTTAKAFGQPHMFIASSAAVYGVPSHDRPLSETETPNPVSEYGRAKLEMEVAAFSHASPVTCLRIGNVAGADQLLLNAAQATPKSPMILDRFDNGKTPVRSYIGPQTLAAVFVSLCNAVKGPVPLPKLVNVAAPVPVEMQDLLLEMASIGQKVPQNLVPARLGAIPRVELSVDILQRFHRFEVIDSLPKEMVRQWQECRVSR